MKKAEQGELLRRLSARFGAPGPHGLPSEIFQEELAAYAREQGVTDEALALVKELGRSRLDNEILKAAGSSVTADDVECRIELWAIARELGLSTKEYEGLSPAAFLRLVKGHFERTQRAQEPAPDPEIKRTRLVPPEAPLKNEGKSLQELFPDSERNRAFGQALLADKDASDYGLCVYVDNMENPPPVPEDWAPEGDIWALWGNDAYKKGDNRIRQLIHSTITHVRRKMIEARLVSHH